MAFPWCRPRYSTVPISLFDRYFLDKQVPLPAIGFYNVANQFGSVVVVVNQGLKSAWIPFLYRIMHDRKDVAIVGLFSLYYVALLVPLALLVALLSREVFAVFGERYLESYSTFHGCSTVYLQSSYYGDGSWSDSPEKRALAGDIGRPSGCASLAALGPRACGAIGAAWSVIAAVRTVVQVQRPTLFTRDRSMVVAFWHFGRLVCFAFLGRHL